MKVGVVVGRFQIDTLHQGHANLLLKVAEQNDVLCVVLGCTEVKGSRRNPLDYVTRKLMLEDWHKQKGALFHYRMNTVPRPLSSVPMVVLPQHDQKSDQVWSDNLDKMLVQTFPGAHIRLYGGRDSFIPHYTGRFETEKVDESHLQDSATDRRNIVGSTPLNEEFFRRGVIYSTYNQWPRTFMVVDVALYKGDTIYLGKRHADEGKLRFFGGFVDQSDKNLEAAALRELSEEARVGSENLQYIGSFQVNDYRYKTKEDGVVMTAFFMAEMADGNVPDGGDDIDEVVPVKVKESGFGKLISSMVDSHKDMMVRFLSKLAKEKRK